MIHVFTVPMVLLLGFALGWYFRGRAGVRERSSVAPDVPDLD
jgi:hypothetical protein